MTNTNNWNIERIGATHVRKAEDTKRYLNELKNRIQKKDPRADMSKFMFDQTLAEYTLYSHLCNRSYLESKEALKAELESLQVNPISPVETPYTEEAYLSKFRSECQYYLNHLDKDES